MDYQKCIFYIGSPNIKMLEFALKTERKAELDVFVLLARCCLSLEVLVATKQCVVNVVQIAGAYY